MIRQRIDQLFHPSALAIVGASARENSPGLAIYRGVVAADFLGKIGLVNPRYTQIEGRACVASLDGLGWTPDLVVVVTPGRNVIETLRDAARIGAGAAVVVTPDRSPDGALARALSAFAKKTGMRILGPGCLGLMAPRVHLDVSLAAQPVLAGDLALISQSEAIASALASWSNERGVGFSALVSTGMTADIDLANLLDHFATDDATRAILLFVEQIGDVPTFMSAARAASRAKPVIVLNPGSSDRRPPPLTHSGAIATPDLVFDAACLRAGLLRVRDIDSMFDAAEALGRIKPFRGRRLVLVANGPGIAQLASARLHHLGGDLAVFDAATMDALRPILEGEPRNPIEVAGDAPPSQVRAVLDVLLASKCVDAAMVIHAPTALSRPAEVAQALVDAVMAARARTFASKPVFAVWYGSTPAIDATFEKARVPRYTRGAIAGFMHVVRWTEAREFLMSAPPNLPADFAPDVEAARAIVEEALTGMADGERRRLGPEASAQLLEAYAIPVAPARFASSPEEAAELARLLIARAGACVVKIASPDIRDKTAVGGIAFDLKSPDAVAEAARAILTRVVAARPDARIEGVTVHPVVRRPDARELLAGLADDPVFGPVVVFGRGGKAVEFLGDCALALPPLDLSLAQDLIDRTDVARVLGEYRDVPPVDRTALALVLVKIAQIAADIPAVREIDLNPILADASGLIAVDSRVVVVKAALRTGAGNPRFAVAPYPTEQEAHFALEDGTRVFVRPVRPADEDLYRAFFHAIPAEDLRLRFFAPVRDFSHPFLARLTQVDYARVYAVAAFDERQDVMVGGVRLVMDPDRQSGEFSILVSPPFKGRGLGHALMQRMIATAHTFDVGRIEGYVLAENEPMLRVCRALGFKLRHDPDERGVMRVILTMRDGA